MPSRWDAARNTQNSSGVYKLMGKFFFRTVVVLLVAAAPVLAQQRQSLPVPGCGKQVRGLRLCLAQTADPAGLMLRIHNLGRRPVAVNLGIQLPSGVRFATAVSVIAVDSAGRSYKTEMSVVPGAIGGRLDPFVISLQPNASYALPILLTKYEAPQSGFRFDLTSSYSVRALLTGEATNSAISAALWHGVVTSNAVTVGHAH